MNLLSSKPVFLEIINKIKKRADSFYKKAGRAPKLAVVIVGNDSASLLYTRKKTETANSLGIAHETIFLKKTVSKKKLYSIITELNTHPTIDGILIQRPLPKQLPEEEVLFFIDPLKDIDGLHPMNVGKGALGLPGLKPCTPMGIITLLSYYRIDLTGKIACILGRGAISGKPMNSLLLQANATTIHCHSYTQNLDSITRQAEILIVATGKPGLIRKNHVTAHSIVIDVGIHHDSNGKIRGDVEFDEVAPIVHGITPVPGGVGPMTIAMLMQNTLDAAEYLEFNRFF